MNALDQYREFLVRRGISLSALGLGDVALEKDDALEGIKLITEAMVPILGGDVYFKNFMALRLDLLPSSRRF
jgi:hypothetical protein